MPINIKKRVEFMLLKYMFHPRVNPVCVKVVGNLHQIIEFGMAKKLGWSYLHEIACLSTPGTLLFLVGRENVVWDLLLLQNSSGSGV